MKALEMLDRDSLLIDPYALNQLVAPADLMESQGKVI
jgi:hypothetical protein